MKICYKNIGIVIVHGFDGNMKQINALTQKLKDSGYQVKIPLLTKKGNYKDWIGHIENDYLSLKERCEEIILIGYSIGGLLALQVARKFKVKGVITFNTSIFSGNFFFSLKHLFINGINLNFYRIKYFFHSFNMNVKRLLKDTKEIIPLIQCDILINQVSNKKSLSCKSANFLYENIDSKYKKKLVFKKNKNFVLQNMIDLIKYIENYVPSSMVY